MRGRVGQKTWPPLSFIRQEKKIDVEVMKLT